MKVKGWRPLRWANFCRAGEPCPPRDASDRIVDKRRRAARSSRVGYGAPLERVMHATEVMSWSSARPAPAQPSASTDRIACSPSHLLQSPRNAWCTSRHACTRNGSSADCCAPLVCSGGGRKAHSQHQVTSALATGLGMSMTASSATSKRGSANCGDAEERRARLAAAPGEGGPTGREAPTRGYA